MAISSSDIIDQSPEHDVQPTEDRRDVGQHMAAAQQIHRLQDGSRARSHADQLLKLGNLHVFELVIALREAPPQQDFSRRTRVASFLDKFDVIAGRKDLAAFLVGDGNIGDQAGDQSGFPHLFLSGTGFRCFLPSKSAYIERSR
jgi:hypothetical protein